ncbi:hypothetical protein [Fusobacterium sp.]|uniref:hypothetical protein n=1 Tax=Fusobacterium sp. TaxID=68766 RepID=UPI0025BA59A1|nr:hypothetical protein [Fusobacterium sp.]MCI7223922.1 hypothetical protein [Fusobacterium sp.]
MKKIGKILLIIIILFLISIALFITGKRHELLIENNNSTSIKYSINGEAYKVLEANKKAMAVSKGINNVIFIKTSDNKVIEKELPSKDINFFVKEAINNSDIWYEEINNK